MSIFTEFPYQNFHELNLNWIIKTIKDLFDEWISFEENIKKWRDDTDAAMQDLKDYINNYFDNLDVQDEINNKLDEMADDGTLDEIINEHIFEKLNDDIEHAPFMPARDMHEEYLDDICDCMASYLASAVDCQSVIGESNVEPKVAYVYTGGTKGYMGVLGEGDYMVYTDTRTIDDVTYPVAYIDCSQFVSLNTKCRNFENSPYRYAFLNQNNLDRTELRKRCFEYGDLDSKPYTIDFLNYTYTTRMAFVMNASGNTIRKVSSKTTSEPVVFEEEVERLEDGDLIFAGNPVQHPDVYLNIHHVMIYMKTLDRLNRAAERYGIQIQDLNNGDHSEYGYIIHVSNTTGEHQNTIKVNTYYSYANTLPSSGARYTYHCHARSNALNSNKALSALTMLTMEYNKTGFGYRNSGNRDWTDYIKIAQSDRGRLSLNQLSYNGATLPNNSNLDTIGDGYFRCISTTANETCRNKPEFVGLYFDVITVGTEVGNTTGMQIAISSYGEIAFRRKIVGSTEWQKWGLYRGLDPARKGYWNFGSVPAHGSVVHHVTIDPPFENIPRVATGLNMGTGWSADSLTNFAISYVNIERNGFDLVASNGNNFDAEMHASWLAY